MQALEWNAHNIGGVNHIKDLVPWMKASFVSNGLHPEKEDGIDKFDAAFIVARNRDIWTVCNYLYVAKIPENKWATLGVAQDYAAGALAMLEEVGSPWAPSDIARMVLGLASTAYSGVAGCDVKVIPYVADGPKMTYRGSMEVPEG